MAWAIVEEYAAGIIDTFPDVEEKLTEYLGVKYKYEDWQEAFKAIDHAEDDAAAAITVIKALQSKALDASNSKSTDFAPPPNISSIQAPLSHTQHPPLNQLAALENELMEQVHELQKRKRMQGTALTLEEMLNPIEEDVIDDGCNFPRGDNEIIEYVNQEINGDDNEDSEDEGKEEDVKEITKPREALDLCARMEQLCLEYSASDIPVLPLQSQLHKLQGHFHHLDDQSRVQAPLDHFWNQPIAVDSDASSMA